MCDPDEVGRFHLGKFLDEVDRGNVDANDLSAADRMDLLSFLESYELHD